MPRGMPVRRVGLGMPDESPLGRRRLLRDLVDAANDAAGQTVEVTAPAAANSEFAVRHRLRRKVSEVEVVTQDAAGSIYRSRPYMWTSDLVLLKYSGAGGRIVLRLR